MRVMKISDNDDQRMAKMIFAPVYPLYLIKMVLISGYRIEDIENKLIQKVRYPDKLVDELAKGGTMDKILRTIKYPTQLENYDQDQFEFIITYISYFRFNKITSSS